jgi:hypothetical protein
MVSWWWWWKVTKPAAYIAEFNVQKDPSKSHITSFTIPSAAANELAHACSPARTRLRAPRFLGADDLTWRPLL